MRSVAAWHDPGPPRGSTGDRPGADRIDRLRRQRLPLPPHQLRPGGHRHPRLPEDHGRRRSAAWRSSASRCSSPGRTGTPATSRPPTTCRPTRRSTTTRSPTPSSPWRTGRSRKAEQARFDPMITGFNPADMYAADHIRRVLQTFPGVFSGIGEFTIHKEFVSSKIAGETASLTDPALDRILDFAGEVGLVVHPAQRHRHAVPEAGPGPLPGRQLGALLAAPSEDHDHLGPQRPRPHRPPGQGPARDRRARADRIPRLAPRLHRHLLGRGGEVRGGHAGDGRRPRPTSSTATRTASCSAPTRSRRRSRRST